MNIQLSEHFNYGKLLRFTLPSIIMMVFTSIYGVVDGFFVSNIVGKTPFAAVIILPFIWEVDGIWISAVLAEIMAVVLTVVYIFAKQKKYKY